MRIEPAGWFSVDIKLKHGVSVLDLKSFLRGCEVKVLIPVVRVQCKVDLVAAGLIIDGCVTRGRGKQTNLRTKYPNETYTLKPLSG